MNDPLHSPPLLSQVAPAFSEMPMDEDEQALGWECAHPVLQIERWLQDAQVAAAVTSSNS